MSNDNAHILDQLASEGNLKKILNQRLKPFLFQSIYPEMKEKYLSQGWQIEKEFKTKLRVFVEKPVDIGFKDEVWTTLAKLGFSKMNINANIILPFSDASNDTQKIDVIAIDDEAILVIQCFAHSGEPIQGNFKEIIATLGDRKEGLIKTLKKAFPTSKHKIKFILATKNYYLCQSEKDKLENYGIIHFDEEIVQYYSELTKHLGLSARFQLLGNLFEGQTIPELDNQIPAIQGKMGGHTYYSFTMEPEKLLKIGYVLHRNKANKKLMPTYQRIIKKARLKSVQEFVQNGGFFPNSIIININSPRGIRFEKSSTQANQTISKLGILYLPRTYRSAYIIDGQHRLYGYANSEYKSKNAIPVVAFVNLDRNQQIKLFMQINENQKAVPKNLRNTLNADLLWDSDDLNDNIKALKLQIAQDLGEDLDSPLYDKVIIGENIKNKHRCITIDTIKQGLDRSNFFGSFSKSNVKSEGTLWRGSNDNTYNILLPYLKGCFQLIKENLPNEWAKGEDADGFLSINAGIESLIRIFSDIMDHLVKSNQVNPKKDTPKRLIDLSAPYIGSLVNRLKNLSSEEKSTFRKSYGTGQRAKYWRLLQKYISEQKRDFKPAGLEEYLKGEARQFNEDSFKMIRDIETQLKEDFKTRLKSFYGDNWFKKGLPHSVYEEASLLAIQKNREVESHEEVEPWDCMNIIDYRKIALFGSNWRDIFEKPYTKPGEEKIRGGKEEKTKWMQKLERIRNQNFHSYSVKEEEYEFLTDLYNWLVAKTLQNSYLLADV